MARRRGGGCTALVTAIVITLLVLLCGCGRGRSGAPLRAGALPTPAARGVSAHPPVGGPTGSAHGLLGSRPATLQAARTEAGHQPVAVRIPGYPGFSPVQPYTTDPSTRGLALPPDARTVAWWSPGALPGDPRGTAVLAAHVSYRGQHGPFTHLGRIPVGSVVSVRQADGAVLNFRVVGVDQVVKSAFDQKGLFRTTGTPRLVLVTCGGIYDRATHNFADNVIVYAVPLR